MPAFPGIGSAEARYLHLFPQTLRSDTGSAGRRGRARGFPVPCIAFPGEDGLKFREAPGVLGPNGLECCEDGRASGRPGTGVKRQLSS